MRRTHSRSSRPLATAVTLALGACGGVSTKLPDQPAVFVQSNTLDPATMAAADLSCLGSHVDPPAPSAPTMLTVEVTDFEKKTPVEGATVEVYTDSNKLAAGTPDGTSGKTDALGKAQLPVPAGSYRVIFRTVGQAGSVETIEFNRAFDDPKRYSVSQATKGTIQAVLTLVPDDTKGVVAGSLRDCKEREVGGVVMETTPTQGTFENKTNTFYFLDVPGPATVPVRAQKWTTGNGVFASLNVPPGVATVTARGLLTAGGAPMVLGSGNVPVRPAAVTVVQLEPPAPTR